MDKPKTESNNQNIDYLLKFSQASEEISALLVSGSLLQDILDNILKIVPDALGVQQMALLYWLPNQKKFRLASVSVSQLSKSTIETFMGKKLTSLYYPGDDLNNVFVRSVKNKSIETEKSIEGSLIPIIDEKLAKVVSTIASRQFKIIVSIPLLFKEEVYGVLALGWEDDSFSDIHKVIFNTFANQAAIAIYNSQLFTQSQNQIVSLENQNRDLASLFSLTSNVSKSLDPYEVGQIAVNTIPLGDIISGVVLAIHNPKSDDLVVSAISKGSLYEKATKLVGQMEGIRISCNDEKTQTNPNVIAFKEKKETYSNNLITSFSPGIPVHLADALVKVLPVKSSYQIPVKVRGKVVGILAFYLKTSDQKDLTSNFIQLLRTYTNQIGIALDNAYLFTKSQHIQSNLEVALKDLQEARRKEKDMIT